MPRVVFTSALQRHIEVPEHDVEAKSVGGALEAVFLKTPRLRAYILDDDGAVRKHIAIWIGGQAIQDRKTLSDEVKPEDEIYVMQALSGG